MSLLRSFLDLAALPLRMVAPGSPRFNPTEPRILVIRRNRLGDMIYTLPLLHALRKGFPKAHLAVACDPPGEDVAGACPAVDEVIPLRPGWNPWQAAVTNAARLQGFDWVLAAKGGFDRRVAVLARLTNGARRIGFEPAGDGPSSFYTDPVAPPENPNLEHQVETLLRLLRPLNVTAPEPSAIDLSLRLPDSAHLFAIETLSEPPLAPSRPFFLINISSTVPLKFREEDFIELAKRLLAGTDLVICFVGAPADQRKARELANCLASPRLTSAATPGPLDLAALLEKSAGLLTPEGGAAHLAAAMGTPALVLWSEGPFQKWYSRGPRHAFVHAEAAEKIIPLERVWQALQPLLPPKP